MGLSPIVWYVTHTVPRLIFDYALLSTACGWELSAQANKTAALRRVITTYHCRPDNDRARGKTMAWLSWSSRRIASDFHVCLLLSGGQKYFICNRKYFNLIHHFNAGTTYPAKLIYFTTDLLVLDEVTLLAPIFRRRVGIYQKLWYEFEALWLVIHSDRLFRRCLGRGRFRTYML